MSDAPAVSRARPLITANQVTFARLVPMPVLCWLVYEGRTWLALVVGVLIGCTDFIDGYLARKHGPTVLGGLMDPIADKVFVAFAFFPLADAAVAFAVPAWTIALMFMREFLVTALRSAYEQRGLSMKTSYLAKVKTWTQMQGAGTIFLFWLLRDQRDLMYGLLIGGLVAPLLALAALWLIRRRFWTGALVMSALNAPLLLLHWHGDVRLTIEILMYVVVAITWMSGIDYVTVALRQLRGRGDLGRADAVRIVGALALPVLVFAALVETSMPAWALAGLLAVEVSVGGLDNLLSHHHAAAGATAWGVRALGASALLAAGIALEAWTDASAGWLGIAAVAISTIGVAREFWRGSDYYLDRRLREKALREQASSATSAADPG